MAHTWPGGRGARGAAQLRGLRAASLWPHRRRGNSCLVPGAPPAQAVDHPFLPTLYCTIQTETHLHFVMEFCDGGELYGLLNSQPKKRLKEAHVRFYVAEVLLALQYLHLLGYVYRDLKVREGWRAKGRGWGGAGAAPAGIRVRVPGPHGEVMASEVDARRHGRSGWGAAASRSPRVAG